VSYGDFFWNTSRWYLSPLTLLVTKGRGYGMDRIPMQGGCVLAINHLEWIDIPLVGALSPRNINYVAKVEAHRVPGLGQVIRAHGTLAVRRGESDRDAVRLMRQAARDGRAVGLFVEGTRQRTGVPGVAMPGAAMVAIQEGVPVIPIGVYGTQFWKLGNFAPCSVAVGEPFVLDGLPKGGKGYKEGSLEIERRIRVLFDWLAEVHARGRPKGLVPPTTAPEPASAPAETPAAP
jgi:1-acyl-sn-glycerol-3-phosphate acyltransferase